MLNIYVKTRVGKAIKQGQYITNLSTGACRVVNGQNIHNHIIWCKSSRSRSMILQTYYAMYAILRDLTAQNKNDENITILSNRTQCVEVLNNSIRIWGEDGWPISKFSYRDNYIYAKQHHLSHVYLNKVPSNYYSYKSLFSLLQAIYSYLIAFHHIHFKMCNKKDSQFQQLGNYLNASYINKGYRQYYLSSTNVPNNLKRLFILNCKNKSVDYQKVLTLLITNYINGSLDEKSSKLKAQLTKALNKIHSLKEDNHKQEVSHKKLVNDLHKGMKHLEKIVDYDNNQMKKANHIITDSNKLGSKSR